MAGHSITIGANQWEIIVGYGHAPEHVSLYSPALNVLISGDMMLPRISTNVSVFDHEPEANPLPCFLTSLDEYRVLPEDVLILPSHGKVFRGLHGRIDDLQQHHKDRLVDTLEACGSAGLNAAGLVPVLFKRELDLHQLTFAMGEALAHLHALWYEGKLRREKRADGIYYFVCS
jgi:glyoxylase-like metal-dependent hydrolase (beta-lactamase superfamily II)